MPLPATVALHSFELMSTAHASISCSFSFLGSQRPLMIRSSVLTRKMKFRNEDALRLCYSDSNHSAPSPSSNSKSTVPASPVLKRRKRYRKEYPGESKGITEELRFVTMRIRNVNGKKLSGDVLDSSSEDEVEEKDEGNLALSDNDNDDNGDGSETW